MSDIYDDATVLDVEAEITQLPQEWQHAIKMADRLELAVIVGYDVDERKVYLVVRSRELPTTETGR